MTTDPFKEFGDKYFGDEDSTPWELRNGVCEATQPTSYDGPILKTGSPNGSSNGHMSGPEAVHAIATGVQQMLLAIGEDPRREGLRDTPRRVAKAWLTELFSGYDEDPEDYITVFDSEEYDQMVLVKDIQFCSFCEHHMLPFMGKVHIGYIPNEKIVGLSKLPRLVRTFSRRLQNQERMTKQIADAVEGYLNPIGTIVVVEAMHTCMAIRGIQSQGSTTTTSAVRGVYLDDSKNSKEEFLRLVGMGGQ